MKKLAPWTGWAAAGVILAVLLWPHHAPAPALPPVVVRSVDSLAITRARDSVVMDSLKGEIAAHDRAATRAVARARTVEAASQRAKGHADSLAAVAVQRDSDATAWRLAYYARDAEAGSLRATVELWRSAYQEQARATMAARAALTAMTLRYRATDRLNAEIERAVAEANRCRILWKIPCPSRELSFAAGAGVGAVAGAVAGVAIASAR